MAVTQNTYTGNGSTVLFSFTFPYLETTDIKVSVNGTITTAYTLANATTIQFNTAPANGAAIRIYRVTDDAALAAQFYPGSAIRSQDLNDNFTQNLYVTQESNRDATSAITTANAATVTATGAVSTANAATATANSAVSTANAATVSAASATASAASAVTTANAASASAASAVSTANTANANATAALNAAAEALAYTVVANVAAIPASPANGDAIRVTNSTGIQSFTPLSGKPVGFVGDAGLTVEIYYSSSTSTWVWVRYYAGDPENRYASAADMTQAQADILGLDSQKLNVTTAASTYLTQSNASSTYQTQAGMSSYVPTSAIGTTVQAYDVDTVKTDVLPTFTVATRSTERTITSGAFDLSTGNLWTVGAITVPNPTNAVAGQTGAIRITAGPVVWSSNFKFPGGTAPTIATFPAVIPYYVSGSSTILMGNAVAGIA
jgi:hypothetical protein